MSDEREERMARKMEALCATFPALRGAPGTKPWSPLRLEEWGSVCSSGELAAVQFVLHVWNLTHDWKCGPFTLQSMARWDDANQAAFAAWAQAPWFA